MLQDREVFGEAIGTSPPFTDPTGRYERILVIGRHQFGAAESQQLVKRIRNVYVPHAHLGPGVTIVVGGAPAQGVDFLRGVYGAFPWIIALALFFALIMLARAFRSLVLAVVSVALNVLSVCAALGLMVLFTRFGVGSWLFGTYQVSQIEGWVPVFVFAVLFGLSMDYEVFLVSRIRESHDAGMSTTDAVVDGISRTGGVVSAAAVILVAAVSGLIFGHVAGLQELGVALALGVLVDATVVRGLVLPSLMTLLGRWNWWLPAWAATVIRTTPSPLEDRGARVSFETVQETT
jgi:RND superfamily putative drug exporter